MSLTKPQLQARVAELEARLTAIVAVQEPQIAHPFHAAEAIRSLCNKEQETFVVLLLNARQKIIGHCVVGIGTLASVAVHPRDVFREAIRVNAHSVVVGHNHPAEHCQPSQADLDVTVRLVSVGRLVGIPVLDHVIVTTREHYSLAASGDMEF